MKLLSVLSEFSMLRVRAGVVVTQYIYVLTYKSLGQTKCNTELEWVKVFG